MEIRFYCGLGWCICNQKGEILASQFDSKEECEQFIEENSNEN